MPFHIHYGGWIKEATGEKTVVVTVPEGDMKREISLALMEGLTVDDAFRKLKQRIVKQMRGG